MRKKSVEKVGIGRNAILGKFYLVFILMPIELLVVLKLLIQHFVFKDSAYLDIPTAYLIFLCEKELLPFWVICA